MGHLLSYKQYIVQYDTINFSHVKQIWIITDAKDLFYPLLKYNACNITESNCREFLGTRIEYGNL